MDLGMIEEATMESATLWAIMGGSSPLLGKLLFQQWRKCRRTRLGSQPEDPSSLRIRFGTPVCGPQHHGFA